MIQAGQAEQDLLMLRSAWTTLQLFCNQIATIMLRSRATLQRFHFGLLRGG